MADEARPHFCVDRMHQQSYRENLVDAVWHLSNSASGSNNCSFQTELRSMEKALLEPA
jgi:hypothetical protein